MKIAASLVAAILVLVCALCVFAANVLEIPFRTLIINNRPHHADAIVIMMGGKKPERIKKAADLFHQGYAPRIIFGNGYYRASLGRKEEDSWVPSGRRYYQDLLRAGVPADRILLVQTPRAYDTATEISDLARALRSMGIKRILLVSTETHTRRVRFIWHRLARDIKADMMAAYDPKLEQWWTSRRGIATVAREYAGFMKELARRFLDRIREIKLKDVFPSGQTILITD